MMSTWPRMAAFGILLASLAFGCDSVKLERTCWAHSGDCEDATPTCYEGRCSHACTTDADCEDLVFQRICDPRDGMCSEPCEEGVFGVYTCEHGRRVYCSQDATLTCDLCDVCAEGERCEGTECRPLRAAGEACASHDECASGQCTTSGLCGARLGEACTPETCQGVCATNAAGDTLCIRSPCPSDCATSTAAGLDWTCVRFQDDRTACLPLEDCLWQEWCGTLSDSTCGMTCPPDGACWTFCVPDAFDE